MPSGSVNAFSAGSPEGVLQGIGFQVTPSLGAVFRAKDAHSIYIANFDVFGAPVNDTLHLPNGLSPNVVSSECALWMCVQAYETLMIDSTLKQRAVQNFSRLVNASQHLDYDAAGVPTLNPYNLSFEDIPATMNPRPNTTYTVDQVAILALENWLPGIFNGVIKFSMTNQHPSGDVVQAIWSVSEDLDGWIRSVAASMTNIVSTYNATSDEGYHGIGYERGVHVQWPWIVLPGTLVGASLMILIVTIVKTARSPIQAWKGSPLALLFMNLDEEIKDHAIGWMDTCGGIEESVGKTRVVVRPDHQGHWVFKAK
jgi:hypothetical protein